MVQGLSSTMVGGVDVTDPKVQMMVDRLNKNPNLLPQSGLTWMDLISLNHEIQRLRQQRAVPPNTNVLQDLAAQAATQGGIADQPISPDMYETFTAAGGGIVAFAGDGPSLVEGETPYFSPVKRAQMRNRAEQQLMGLGSYPMYNPQTGELSEPPMLNPETGEPMQLTPTTPTIPAAIRGLPAVATATQPSPGGIVPPRVARRPAAPVVSTPMTSSGEPSGVGYETLSPGDLAMAAANRKREAYVESMQPGTREEAIAAVRKEYEKEGIGKAAQERSKQLAERESRMKEGQDRSFWLNAAAAFFDMAAEASKSGQAGGALQSLLRSASKGGQSFAERVRVTRDKYETAQQQLEEAKANLAEKNEQVRMGIIDKGGADFKSAQSLYRQAQGDVIKADERAAELMKTREAAQLEAEQRRVHEEKLTRMNNDARLAAARISSAGRPDISMKYLQEIEAAKGDEKALKEINAKYSQVINTIFPQRTDKPLGAFDKLLLPGATGQSTAGAPKREGFSVERSPQ